MFSVCFLITFSYEESDRFTVMDNRQVICLGVYSQADELTVRHGCYKQLQIPRFPLSKTNATGKDLTTPFIEAQTNVMFAVRRGGIASTL